MVCVDARATDFVAAYTLFRKEITGLNQQIFYLIGKVRCRLLLNVSDHSPNSIRMEFLQVTASKKGCLNDAQAHEL